MNHYWLPILDEENNRIIAKRHDTKGLNFANKKEEEVQTVISNFTCHAIYQTIRQEYELVGNYKEILKVCNHKPMLDIAGSVFGVSKEDYCDELLRILNSVDKSGLINAMINYLPDVLIYLRREN